MNQIVSGNIIVTILTKDRPDPSPKSRKPNVSKLQLKIKIRVEVTLQASNHVSLIMISHKIVVLIQVGIQALKLHPKTKYQKVKSAKVSKYRRKVSMYQT